jgi:flagellar hook-length control protein FliK
MKSGEKSAPGSSGRESIRTETSEPGGKLSLDPEKFDIRFSKQGESQTAAGREGDRPDNPVIDNQGRVSNLSEGFGISEQGRGRIVGGLSERVIEQVNMMRESSGLSESEIRMKLHPAELGELKISVIMKDDNRVEASIVTENVQVKAVIDAGTDKLSDSLLQNGFVLDNLDVSIDDPGQNGDAESRAWSGSGRVAEPEDRSSDLRPVFESRNGGVNCLA